MSSPEERKRYIHEITEEEANRLLDSWKRIVIGEGRQWGGLFLYRSLRRDKPWWSHRKYNWVAIDDTEGMLHVQTFKSKEKAIEWLANSKGPKTMRI